MPIAIQEVTGGMKFFECSEGLIKYVFNELNLTIMIGETDNV
jgi:hypothetical protein